MPTAAFIDTNILLYAASNGRLDPEKIRDEVYDRVMVLNPFDQGGRWITEDLPRRSWTLLH